MEFFLRTILEKTHLSCDLISPCSLISDKKKPTCFIYFSLQTINLKERLRQPFQRYCGLKKGKHTCFPPHSFPEVAFGTELDHGGGSELRGESSPAHSCVFLVPSSSCTASLRCENTNKHPFSVFPICWSFTKKKN